MDLIIFERKAFEEFATSIKFTRCQEREEKDKQLA